MKENWIKLHSKILEWGWYKNNNVFRVFIHCLLKANWKDGEFEGQIIPRGSFITGRKELSKQLMMTEQEIRTALKHLKSTNEITIKTTNNFNDVYNSLNSYYLLHKHSNNFRFAKIADRIWNSYCNIDDPICNSNSEL